MTEDTARFVYEAMAANLQSCEDPEYNFDNICISTEAVLLIASKLAPIYRMQLVKALKEREIEVNDGFNVKAGYEASLSCTIYHHNEFALRFAIQTAAAPTQNKPLKNFNGSEKGNILLRELSVLMRAAESVRNTREYKSVRLNVENDMAIAKKLSVEGLGKILANHLDENWIVQWSGVFESCRYANEKLGEALIQGALRAIQYVLDL